MRLLKALVLFTCFAALAATALAQETRESWDLCVSKVGENGNYTIMKEVPQAAPQPGQEQEFIQEQFFLLGTSEGSIYLYNFTQEQQQDDQQQEQTQYRLEQIGLLVNLEDLVKTRSELDQDLQQQVAESTFMGLLNFAFHPNFTENGLFYTLFTCDENNAPECRIESCNENCPQQLCNTQTNQCEYDYVLAVTEWYVVVNETAVNDRENIEPDQVIANVTLSRTILVFPLTEAAHHGGALLFDETGRLIVGVGDGLTRTDEQGTLQQSLAQNLTSPYGKIHRVGVFDTAGDGENTNEQTYIVPEDNPFVDNNEALPLIWAYGFRNPWRCVIDSANTSRLLCVDSALNQTQEVNIIERGGNYGWPIWEGDSLNPFYEPSENEQVDQIDHIDPLAQYNQTVDGEELDGTFASGAVVYRGNASQCHYGRVVITDLFGAVFIANLPDEEQQEATSANLTKINLVCSPDASAFQCTQDDDTGNQEPVMVEPNRLWGVAQSMPRQQEGGENEQSLPGRTFILSSEGIWMIIAQDRCNIRCPQQNEDDGADTPVLPAN